MRKDFIAREDETLPTLRVTCVKAIISPDGDLIVAGTPGTVLRWKYDAEDKRTDEVCVSWDYYVFLDTQNDPDAIHTYKGLEVETQYDNLRWTSL